MPGGITADSWSSWKARPRFLRPPRCPSPRAPVTLPPTVLLSRQLSAVIIIRPKCSPLLTKSEGPLGGAGPPDCPGHPTPPSAFTLLGLTGRGTKERDLTPRGKEGGQKVPGGRDNRDSFAYISGIQVVGLRGEGQAQGQVTVPPADCLPPVTLGS